MIQNLKTYYFNSKKNKIDNNDTDSKFKVKIEAVDPGTANKISVSQIVIPKSYWQIDKTKNYFLLKIQGVYYEVELFYGNYTLNQFLTEMGNKITAVAQTQAGTNLVFSCSTVNNLYTSTGVLVISCTNNTTNLNLSLNFPDRFIKIAGFSKNDFDYQFTNNNLMADYVLNLNAANNIYLLSDISKSNNTQSASNILASVNAFDYEMFSFVQQDFDILTNMKEISGSQETIEFTIVDEDMIQLDLNGISVSMTVHIFYYDDKIVSRTKDFFKLSALTSGNPGDQ